MSSTRRRIQIRVGVLVCDHVAPALRHASRGRDYPDMYRELLVGAEPGIGVRAYDVVGGELPPGPRACDAWIVTGSRHDAHGDEDWIRALRAFVAGVADAGSRLVGICFGHQIVAHALGGRSGPADGWRVGPHVTTVESTAWFAGGEVTLHAMHRDAVHELPPGGRTVAAGTTARHPVVLVGDTVLGIQDHPEFDDRYVRGLIAGRRSRLGDELADAALAAVGTVPTDGATVGRWIVDFLLDRRRAR